MSALYPHHSFPLKNQPATFGRKGIKTALATAAGTGEQQLKPHNLPLFMPCCFIAPALQELPRTQRMQNVECLHYVIDMSITTWSLHSDSLHTEVEFTPCS